MKKTILVTGGLGYIGSHTVIELIENGYEVVIVDSLVNSKLEVLNRLETITGVRPTFYEYDVRNEEGMEKIFSNHDIFAVIHFAGLKSVGESVQKPQLYYDNNIGSTEVLLKKMKEHGVHNIVFSSSATVYGQPERMPLYETDPIGNVTNPYAETKVKIEEMLEEISKNDPEFNPVILRYFNPIGAHKSGLIGEDPNGIPNNLMPYVTQVAVGKLPMLSVFGNDYPTPDGTCIRDYIHVVDLAHGHLLALKKLEEKPGRVIYNLGTGVGTSVLELINAFMEANHVNIPYKIVGRRPGDLPQSYANADKAFREMGFKTKYTIVDSCRDSWNWQKKNPKGFDK